MKGDQIGLYLNIILKKKKKFLKIFFSFLFNIFRDNNELNVNLVANFYIPINEIFFFLFGIILISFGYRFKLRIDIVIILLIILIFATKILLYIFYWYEKYNFFLVLGIGSGTFINLLNKTILERKIVKEIKTKNAITNELNNIENCDEYIPFPLLQDYLKIYLPKEKFLEI